MDWKEVTVFTKGFLKDSSMCFFEVLLRGFLKWDLHTFKALKWDTAGHNIYIEILFCAGKNN